MAELDGVRVSAVFATDAELDAGAGLIAFLAGDLDQLADPGLVDRGGGGLLPDLVFNLGGEEAAGSVTRQAEAGLP